MQDEKIEVNLSKIFIVLKRYILLIVFATILGGFVGFGISKYAITPQYEASVNMIINTRMDTPTTVTNDNITSAKNLVNTYAIIIKSNTVLNQIIENLEIDITYQELADRVDVSAINSTQVLKIAVQDEKAEAAGEIVEQIILIAPNVIEKAVAGGTCSVVSEVEIGKEPCSPIVSRYILLFAFISNVLIISIIVFKALINNYIVDDADIQKYLDIPLLGVIPEIDSKSSLLVSNENEPFVYVEAYKMLRTHLKFIMKSQGVSSFVVTSGGPEESKSCTAINLGITLAQEGKRVIIIDCDLRKPILHKYMKVNRGRKGVTNILTGEVKLEDCIKSFPEININVLFAGTGPSNPTELLSSESMLKIMSTLKNEYDYVIVDAPPILAVTDASILGSMVDGTLLVVRSNYVPPAVAVLAKQKLEEVGVKNFGVILTRFDIKNSNKKSGYAYAYGYDYKK